MGIQHGTLGVEAVGKAPIFSHGQLIGEVSVGFLDRHGSRARGPDAGVIWPSTSSPSSPWACWRRWACRGGSSGRLSAWNSREIAALLQEREAMLHGIREGVLGYDKTSGSCWPTISPGELLDLLPEFVRPPAAARPAAGPARRRGDRRDRGQRPARAARRPGAGREPDADHQQTTGTSAGWSRSRTGPNPRRSSGSWTRRSA